jgi:hypothetical protein
VQKNLPRLESPRRRFSICFFFLWFSRPRLVLSLSVFSLPLWICCAARNFASCGEPSRRRRDSFGSSSRKARRVLVLSPEFFSFRFPSISHGAHRQALSHHHCRTSVAAVRPVFPKANLGLVLRFRCRWFLSPVLHQRRRFFVGSSRFCFGFPPLAPGFISASSPINVSRSAPEGHVQSPLSSRFELRRDASPRCLRR